MDTGGAEGTRARRTLVPGTEKSHIGRVAGPRLVSIEPVVRRALVICRGEQPPQSPVELARMSAAARAAEARATMAVVPSCQVIGPSGGGSVGNEPATSTIPASRAILTLAPTRTSQS